MHAFSLDQASATEPIRGALSRQLLNGATANAPLIFSDCLKIPFSTNVSGTGLYLDAERQQIGAVGEAISGWGIYAAWFAPLSWEKGVTEIALIDTSSTVQVQMQTRRTLSMTGELMVRADWERRFTSCCAAIHRYRPLAASRKKRLKSGSD